MVYHASQAAGRVAHSLGPTMTAGPEQDQRAAQAQAAGESAAAKHASDTLAQHRIAGSATAGEQAVTADGHAVSWSTADDAASPSLQPSTPRQAGQHRQHDGPSAA